MQLKRFLLATVLAASFGTTAVHASGPSTQPARDGLTHWSTAPRSGRCIDTVAERQALLQPASALTTTHRSGLTQIR